MNWNAGYSAIYYYTIVDPATWRDMEPHDLVDGSVMRTTDGLMQSADITITELPAEGEAWVRIYLNAVQGADGAREALFTGLLQAPATDWNGTREEHKAELYSVLKPAEDVLLPRGWYAPAGMDGAQLAADLLGVGPAPVTYANAAPALSSAIVAESKETRLSMAKKIVEAIGWRIRISGSGEISIEPRSDEAAAILDPLENDIVEMEVTDTRDWYTCPNVLRATSGGLTAIARDDDPDSPYSTASRGREIWAEESKPALNDGEGIEAYARRRLRELQAPVRSVEYSRRYLPDVMPGDVVALHYPAQRIDADFRVVSQKIEMGYGARISEEAEAYG